MPFCDCREKEVGRVVVLIASREIVDVTPSRSGTTCALEISSPFSLNATQNMVVALDDGDGLSSALSLG